MAKAKRSGGRIAVILICVACLLLAGAALVFFNRFVRIDGEFLPRDSQSVTVNDSALDMDALLRLQDPATLDLRSAQVSAEEYETLAEAFPNCHISWCVPLSCGSFDNASESLKLSSFVPEDAALLDYFPALREIDARGLENWQDLRALEQSLTDCELSWTVSLAGKEYSPEISSLDLGDSVTAAELTEKLEAFPALSQVSISGQPLTGAEQLALRKRYPNIEFAWTVALAGDNYQSGETTLDLSGRTDIVLDELLAAAPLFDGVTALDMSGCGFSNDEMLQVMEAFPNADVLWTFSIYGVEVSSLDEEVDLSNIPISDTSEIENALQFMPRLQKVIMSDCGISDEDMDALNKRHEDVRFVWTVYFGKMINEKMYSLRTDTDHFIASLHFGYEADRQDLNDETIQPLKYCTDIVALDLGHHHFTNLDFIKDMKKLRFLITADGDVEDISVLAELPELYFCELFLCPIKDFSPLLECEKLRHLNICHCFPEDMEVIKQLTQLERLWFMSAALTYQDIIDLREALPDTQLQLGMQGTATGGTWRYVDAYYEMRDILGAYYMAGGTEAPK